MTETATIDVARAWSFLLDSRRGDTARSAGPLVIDPGGAWRSTGPITPDAETLLDALAPLCRPGPRSLVIGQLGQSLDGRIATVSGASHYVTGDAGLRHLHRLRALCDAVVVGAGTVAADDPQLTVRHVDGPSPVRAVIDPAQRLDSAKRVFSDGDAPTLLFYADERGAAGGRHGHAERIALPARDGRIASAAILGALQARGLRRVLIEGGGITVSRFLEAGMLDRLHVIVAPLIIGSGRMGFTLPEIASLAQARRPAIRHIPLGGDMLFDCAPDTSERTDPS